MNLMMLYLSPITLNTGVFIFKIDIDSSSKSKAKVLA